MSVTVKHPFVSAVADSADTSLVRPSNWNADHTIIGLGTAAEKDVGVANGVASLDAGGKVPVSELPAAVLGALSYQGTWNASTNTPTLASGVGVKGYYYVVSVAGSTNLDGVTDWVVGDWAVFNGTAWQKVDNTDAVTSVNGQTGTVVLAVGDISGAANAPTNTNITSMTGVTGGISSPDYIQFDTTYATTLGIGQLGWDGNDTLSIGMTGGHVIQHIGEDQFFYTKATSTITKGQVVMFTGAVGASGVPTGAPATGISDGSYIMGVAAENIATNGFGLIQTFGTLRNVNTSGYADGDILWYNPAVTGGLTKVKPVAPNVKVQIAAVVNGGSSGGGTILIRLNPGSTLGGTDSNAQIDTPTNGQIITYDGLDGYWKNTALTAGTAISVNASSTGVLTVANTAPDQTVSLTAGTGISTTGTYPNFTITNTAPSSGGTVTSVTGTAPVVSSGGNTPAISMAAATTSVDGYLTSTDWNTFNNKTSNTGTVTSVGGTGTVNGITLTGTVTTSGSLTLGGTLSGVSLTTQVSGTLPVANGGTGAVTLTGYVKGSGTSALTASATIPNTDVSGLGTMSTQNANAVAITGGTVNGATVGATTAAAGTFTSLTDSGNLTFTGTGNRITGDFSNATIANRVLLQSSTSNGQTSVGLIPNGTSTQTQLIAFNSTDPANSSYIQTLISATEARINSGQLGTGTNLPMTFYTGGSERVRIDTSGNLLVGTTSNLARLTVVSATADTSTKGIQINNSAGTELLAIRSEGAFFTGGASASPYNSTTGAGVNAHIASNGQLQRSTSSLKYKTAVNDAIHGLAELLALRPVTYKGKSKADGDKVFGGLIAEEVHEAGLTEFVQYAEDGSPDALAYGNMISLCIKAIQELKAEIDLLKGN